MTGFFIDFTGCDTQELREAAILKELFAHLAESAIGAAEATFPLYQGCLTCLAKSALMTAALAAFTTHAPAEATYEELYAHIISGIDALLPQFFANARSGEAANDLDLASLTPHPGTGKGH